MPSKGKVKGCGYERELVNHLRSFGFMAKRAYASNGNSLGLHEEVDVLFWYDLKQCKDFLNNSSSFPIDTPSKRLKIQCKRKKALPKFLGLTEHVDASVVREDKGESYIVMRLDDFIERFLK